MKVRSTMILPLLALMTLIGCNDHKAELEAANARTKAAEAETAQVKAEAESTALRLQNQIDQMQKTNRLVGTWSLRDSFGNKINYKLITPTTWALLEVDNSTGDVTKTLGGTYTLNDDTYTENVDYTSKDSPTSKGQRIFTCTIDGDTWHHRLKDPPMYTDPNTGETKPNVLFNISEDWERVKP